MKFITFGAAMAASFAGLCLAQPASTATNWKLATGYRAESFHTQNIAQFAREVGITSGGQLTIEVFPNNALAKLADISQAVRDPENAPLDQATRTSAWTVRELLFHLLLDAQRALVRSRPQPMVRQTSTT